MTPRFARIVASITIASSALGGCTSSFTRPTGASVEEAYRSGTPRTLETAVIDEASPLARPKDRPVYVPPRIFAVHVARHVDAERDLLIGDHWVFFKLTEGRWYAESSEEAKPASDGKADPKLAEPLRRLGDVGRILVPTKGKP